MGEIKEPEYRYPGGKSMIPSWCSRLRLSGRNHRSAIIPSSMRIILRDGWFSVKLVASGERLSKYTDELAAAGIPYQVLSVTQSHEASELLTERQWQFITEAVDHGYYDTPRGCTLTELAGTLDVHKSAASRLRHRAESRIVKEFVSEAAQ